MFAVGDHASSVGFALGPGFTQLSTRAQVLPASVDRITPSAIVESNNVLEFTESTARDTRLKKKVCGPV
jgi:hypothetical protein